MSRDSFKKHMYVQHQGGRESWQCHMCKSVLGSKDSFGTIDMFIKLIEVSLWWKMGINAIFVNYFLVLMKV